MPRKEIELQLDIAKSEMLDYKLEDFRYYVKRFKHLDYTKTENRKALIDTFVNRVTYLGGKNGKIRYNVTGFSSGSLYERLVERPLAKANLTLMTNGRSAWLESNLLYSPNLF